MKWVYPLSVLPVITALSARPWWHWGCVGHASCFRSDASTMGGQGTVQKQISDSPASLQKNEHWQSTYIMEKTPQELLPIALPCDRAARPPRCGEVGVETSSWRKCLLMGSHMGHCIQVFVFQNSNGAHKPEKNGREKTSPVKGVDAKMSLGGKHTKS